MSVRSNKLRNRIYVEPKNTRINHPENLYIILGHGSEDMTQKKIVPKGCILVVKSHSGDDTYGIDYYHNIKEIINPKNKEIVFDPVFNQQELFRLLNSDYEAGIKNITASHSSAIYREGDTYNDFTYGPFSVDQSIGYGGILKINYNDIVSGKNRPRAVPVRLPSLESSNYQGPSAPPAPTYEELDFMLKSNSEEAPHYKDILQYNFDIKSKTLESFNVNPLKEYDAFVFNSEINNFIYNPSIDIGKIINMFKFSRGYDYFYTKEYIEDNLQYVIDYINIYFKYYMSSDDRNILSIKDMNNTVKRRLEEEYELAQKSEGINKINTRYDLIHTFYNDFFKISPYLDKPAKYIIIRIFTSKIENIIDFINRIATVKQSQLFEDMVNGLIKPGVFYNLVCRDTERTFHSNLNKKKSGVLNSKYIENPILPSILVPEIKNRIGESEIHRKFQARNALGRLRPNNWSNYGNNVSSLFSNDSATPRSTRKGGRRSNKRTTKCNRVKK